MECLSDIAKGNPWWKHPGAIETDRYVAAWEESGLRWLPPVIDDFVLDRDAVYTLSGPDQIGKTTAVKMLIRALLAGGTRPQNVLYYSCYVVDGARELHDAIREYLKRGGRAKSERTFVFLDEVGIVQRWQMAIRRLWGTGLLKNCTVIATGSRTADLARSAGRLPGRCGGLNGEMDKILHPLSFPEYVALADKALAERIAPVLNGGHGRGRGRGGPLDSLFLGRIAPALRALSRDLDEINLHLDDYAATGGIPWIVDQARGRRAVPEDSYAAYLGMILDGTAAFGRIHEYTVGILEALIGSMGRPVSWSSLAKNAGLPDAAYAESYVSTLEGMSVLSTLRQYDAKSKTAMPGGARKMHFADPFYLHVMRGWIVPAMSYDASQEFLRDEDRRGRVVEGIVAGHLIRMALRRGPRKPWLNANRLSYWGYGPEKEVDFVYNDGHVEVPIEVKFGSRLTGRDLDGITAFKRATGAKNGLVLTRSTLSAGRECLKVPAALFLLLA